MLSWPLDGDELVACFVNLGKMCFKMAKIQMTHLLPTRLLTSPGRRMRHCSPAVLASSSTHGQAHPAMDVLDHGWKALTKR